MRPLMALLAGLLFGVGLIVAGMTQPAVVLGFLDIFGAWNPRLLFVMGGAVLTTAIGFRWVLKRTAPWLASTFALPTARGIDRRLLLGAALFGMGWGLAGYCPGPALVSLGSGMPSVVLLVAAMAVGWWLAARWQATNQRK